MNRHVTISLPRTKGLDYAWEQKEDLKEVLSKMGLSGFEPDDNYTLKKVPAPPSRREGLESMEFAAEAPPYFFEVAGFVDDADLDAIREYVNVRVESNPSIAPHCGDSHGVLMPHPAHEPVGSYEDIQEQLSKAALAGWQEEGERVYVAILDTGISLEFLRDEHGLEPRTDDSMSFSFTGIEPFQTPKAEAGHGTAMAFNALLVAPPKCTLLDFPIMSGVNLEAFLEDAKAVYRALLAWMNNYPGGKPRLVINNSWGLKNLCEDIGRGKPGNYSHSLDHSFNVLVGQLAQAGADILFSAGNCGDEDQPPRKDPCGERGDRTIYGANSHPHVLTVSAVDVNHDWLGRSSKGPGAFNNNKKPDICAYSHFEGARTPLSAVDRGTSTACAVATSVVAAIRSQYSPDKLSPGTLQNLIRESATRLGTTEYDCRFGYGVLNVPKLLNLLPP